MCYICIIYVIHRCYIECVLLFMRKSSVSSSYTNILERSIQVHQIIATRWLQQLPAGSQFQQSTASTHSGAGEKETLNINDVGN